MLNYLVKVSRHPAVWLGLLSFSAQAAPQMFTITATVVNTASQIGEEAALDFGMVLSRLPPGGGTPGASGSSKVTVSAEGRVTSSQAPGASMLMNVGSAAQRGKYVVSGFPAGTTIGVSFKNEGGLALPLGRTAGEASCDYGSAADAMAAHKAVLVYKGDNPASTGSFFCVDSVTSNLTLSPAGMASITTGEKGASISLGATLVSPVVPDGSQPKVIPQGPYSGQILIEVYL